jgi:hypothetical protein
MTRNQTARLLLTVASTMWLSQAGGVELSTNVTNPDGTDNVDGRAKNRRVEVVINTCS